MLFFALVNDVTAVYGRVDVGDLIVAYGHAALLDEPSGLAVGGAKFCRNEDGYYSGHLYKNFHFGQLAAASERRLCLGHRLIGLLLPVHELSELVCKNFFLFVYAARVPLFHLADGL